MVTDTSKKENRLWAPAIEIWHNNDTDTDNGDDFREQMHMEMETPLKNAGTLAQKYSFIMSKRWGYIRYALFHHSILPTKHSLG